MFEKEFTAQEIEDMGTYDENDANAFYSLALTGLTIKYKYYFMVDGKAYYDGEYETSFADGVPNDVKETIRRRIKGRGEKIPFTWTASEDTVSGTIRIRSTDYEITGVLDAEKLTVTYPAALAELYFLNLGAETESATIECAQGYVGMFDGILIDFGITESDFNGLGATFTAGSDYTLDGKVINFTDSGFDSLLVVMGNAGAILVYNNELVSPIPASFIDSIDEDSITFAGELDGLIFTIPTHCTLSHNNKVITLTDAGARLISLI